MKKSNHEKVVKAKKFVDDAKEIIDQVWGDEQDYYDSRSDAWYESDKADELQDQIDGLEYTSDALGEVLEQLEELI